MAQLVVRNLDEEVKAKLRRRATAHGRSMEEEVRAILRDAVKEEARPKGGLGTEIAALFRGIGLREGEEIQELRGYTIKPVRFRLNGGPRHQRGVCTDAPATSAVGEALARSPGGTVGLDDIDHDIRDPRRYRNTAPQPASPVIGG